MRFQVQEYVRWEDIDAAGIINYQAYLRGKYVLAAVRQGEFKAVRVPDEVREKLAKYVENG